MDANGPPDAGEKEDGQPLSRHPSGRPDGEEEHTGFLADLHVPTVGGVQPGKGGASALPADVVVVKGEMGASCTAVCAAYKGSTCSAPFLKSVNNCVALGANFPCSSCQDSSGADQPAMVDPSTPLEIAVHGRLGCLVNLNDPVCDGSFTYTQRLCTCVLPGGK